MRIVRITSVAAATLVISCGRSVVTAPSPAGGTVRAASKPAARLAPIDALVPASPATVGMDPELPARIDSIVAVAINEGVAPGAAVAVGRFGRLVHLKGYGAIDYAAGAPAVDPTTLYDMASLTKVVATTTAAMILEDEGKLDVSRPVHSYVPELDAPDKAGITVRQILTHRGGFEAFAPLHRQFRGRAEYLAQINARPLTSVPGTQMVYSDWDFILMQAVVERITGTTLDAFVASRVFGPLAMSSARFTPDTADAVLLRHVAVTAMDSVRGLIHGVVHDPNAWAMGGVAGHAGLFASARDLATFAQMMLNGGTYAGTRIVKQQTLARWTAVQDPTSSRGLGWDTPSAVSSAGRYFSPRSFGHTGFTGTSIWVDPERSLFVIILSNRVNSHGESTRHTQLRRDLADAVQSAIHDAPLVDWEARR
ncbi:MAG TPA: serine hydrolase [Gemmatimonadaceae bacterium]|jgi:CubicO group peptidase (beta-lactamase class C family)|nr:serine hydrolase [Gemmatimonadaceae bacterium]